MYIFTDFIYIKNTILILHIKGGDFMRSLSMEVTHVASYLEKFKREILEMIEKSSKVFQEITDTDTSDKNYVDSVRKKIKDYDKEFQKDFEYQDEEFKLFIQDLEDIAKHKNDEYVIYSLRTYAAIERELKDINKKKLKKLIDNIEDSEKYADGDNDFVIVIAYKNMLSNIEKYKKRLDTTIDKLNKITKLKEDDEE